jgi:virginiamycin B lyase
MNFKNPPAPSMSHKLIPIPLPFLIVALSWALFAAPSLAANEASTPEKDGASSSQVSLEFHEWPVPWENTRPRDPDRAPDGTIWFVGQTGDYIGHLYPATGTMKRYDVPGAGPHTVIVDSDGFPWYAGNRDRHIGRLDPATGEVKRYEMPEGVNDPHTLAWTSEGDMWFTVQRSGRAGYIGKLRLPAGEVDLIEVPGSGMRPYGIIVDRQDRPWIAFMGDNAIGTVAPGTLDLEIIKTPDEGSRIRRLGLTSDGRVWWADAARGFIGVYDPAERTMKQWQSPGGARSSLYAVAVDTEDRVWYVESGPNPNRFIGFDANSEDFISINEVPSGGGSVRHMIFDRETNAIWFGTDTHTIGRARVP